MALTQVREPPHVAQSHAEAHAGEQILGFVVPFGPVARLLLLHPLQVGVRGYPLIQTRVWDLEWKFHHAGVWRASETGMCCRWAGLGWLGLLHARKEDGSSLWQPPLAVSFTTAVRPWRGAELFTLTYGTAVISRSLQFVVYYVMSAILGRCDHLEMVNMLHMMPSFAPPPYILFTTILPRLLMFRYKKWIVFTVKNYKQRQKSQVGIGCYKPALLLFQRRHCRCSLMRVNHSLSQLSGHTFSRPWELFVLLRDDQQLHPENISSLEK